MAADGSISIKIEVDGKQIEVASKGLDGLEGAARGAGKGADDAKSKVDEMGKETERAGSKVKQFAVSLGLVAVAAGAFHVLKSSLDDAITRFDTLNKFPKVLQALGVSAEDSERAMEKLSDGIDGLPTKLDEISSTAQRMYTSFNDMDKAADSALALNNALLGSGASAEQASRGTEMYLKALQTGTVDMVTWRTLSETMDVGLVKIAESMGYVGKTAKDDLYKALQTGTITLDEFNDAMIEVGTGSGIMAKLARENTLGLSTSLQNLKTSAARGLAEIITAFDELSKATTGNDIAQNIDRLKHIINASFKTIKTIIESTTPVFKLFGKAASATLPVVRALSPAIIGLMTAYGAYVVISRASDAIQAANTALKAAMTVKTAATFATSSLTAAQVANTTATQADAIAKALQAGTINLSTVAIGLLTGKITLSTAAQVVATGASYALGAAIKFLMGPIGWVTGGIALLTTGIIAAVKWMGRTTDEGEKLAEETEKLAKRTDKLIESVDESSEAYEENIREIEVAEKQNMNLAESITKLTNKEQLSASEKRTLNAQINELNDAMGNLNLTYNEEANALNMSSEELEKRIKLMADLDKGMAAQERLNELTREQVELELELEGTIALKQRNNELMHEGTITAQEHTDELEKLINKEGDLRDALEELGIQQEIIEEITKKTMESMRDAVEQGIADQIITYEKLPEKMQEVVGELKGHFQEYKEAATDMFDTLSDKTEFTIAELTENMEENQRVIGEWADNIALLSQRGIDEGLLEYLREAGPETAGLTKEIVNASDEELKEFESVFKQGTDLAMDAMATSLGVENSEIFDALGHLIDDVDTTLRDKINAAGFDDIGIDIGTGLSSGIDESTAAVESSSKNMAKAAEKAARDESETASPSRVFMRIGDDLAEGLSLGISDGTPRVMDAIKRLFEAIKEDSRISFEEITKGHDKAVQDIEKSLGELPKIATKVMTEMLDALRTGATTQIELMRNTATAMTIPFNDQPAEFRRIGQDSMAGLNAGLNSGAGQVMSTARRIANNVAATMKNALKIHSPSWLMRDEVGAMIPAGVAVGIEKNERVALDQVEKLSTKMVDVKPLEAMFGANMRYSSAAGGGTTNNTTNTTNINETASSSKVYVKSVVEMNNKEIAEGTWQDISKLLNDDIKKQARSKGVLIF